jgi:hypothetical protein
MGAALKTQIIDAIEDTYLCELQNKKYTGYLVGVTARELIDHLLDRYGKNHPSRHRSMRRTHQ